MAGEFRHNTATSTFLVSPNRGRVVGAKIVAASSRRSRHCLDRLSADVGGGNAVAGDKHIHVDIFSRNVGLVLLGGIAAMAIYAAIGVGVGSLIRNQMAAVVIALAWVLVVESLLVGFAHEICRWTPGGALPLSRVSQRWIASDVGRGGSSSPTGWRSLLPAPGSP